MTPQFQFACQHCGQMFSVSSRKVGLQLHCPKCQASIIVPTMEEAATRAGSEEPELPPAPPPPPPPPVLAGAVPARETPLEDGRSRSDPPAVDTSKLAISRTVVYTQGMLLGLVGVSAFVLGILVARSSPDVARTAGVDTLRPCLVHGEVTRTAGSGRAVADVGAVVLAVPTGTLPDEKLVIEGLRPQDPELPAEHPTREALRILGAAQTRTDDRGAYQLHLPHPGSYFLLVLSAGDPRPRGKLPDRKDLAELGRYVTDAYDLLGHRQYAWVERRLKSDARLDWQFGPTTD